MLMAPILKSGGCADETAQNTGEMPQQLRYWRYFSVSQLSVKPKCSRCRAETKRQRDPLYQFASQQPEACSFRHGDKPALIQNSEQRLLGEYHSGVIASNRWRQAR